MAPITSSRRAGSSGARGVERRILIAAAVVAVAGSPLSVFARQSQEPAPVAAPAPVPVPAPAAAPAEPAPAAAEPAQPAKLDAIGFNFKDAPIDQVLDFISRESGVPIINEAPTPQGTITFISSEKYTLADALSIVNLNLARFGVHLRREAQYLYLATLQESIRRPTVVSTPQGVGALTPDQIVTVNIPLDNARVEQVLETVKQLVSPIGGVLAVPAQNMLIVVESAGQVRRIREIVASIDSVKPADSAFRLFPLRHAQAETVLNALKGLVGERSRTVIVDKDGSQRTVQDTQVQGLNLQADPRTNSIIAVGPEARLRTVEEVIALLDVPESAAGESASMATYALSSAKAEDAARQVTGLFANVEPKRKPVVLALGEQNKVMVVGAPAMLAQAATLLSELDPGSSAQGGARGAVIERRAVTIRLKHAAPATLSEVLTRLATPRQQAAVRTTATPDGRGLIIIGPAPDVDGFEQLVASLDVPDATSREVRLLRLAGDAKLALARAEALYAQTGKSEVDPVRISADEATKTAVISGSKAAVAAFDQLLATVKATGLVEQESRRFELSKNRPSVVASKLQRLSRPLLTPDDGSPLVEPILEPIDELGLLVIRARPEQLAILAPMVSQLDGAGSAGDLRVVRLSSPEPQAVLDRARKLYDERAATAPEKPGSVGVEFDARSGSAILTGSADGLRLFGEILAQAQQLVPPMRSTRVIDVQSVTAAKVLEPLRTLLASADSIDPARAVPEPTIQIVERTNSLLVTAEPAQHALVADFVARLDRPESADVPPIKLLQLRTAEAPAIAAMLTEQYSRRPQTERMQKPVDVRADAGTNTLIVTAHPDLFDGIRTFVEELNKESKDGAGRVTKLFPLKVAKATDVAAAMDRLFPEPPMPTDRLGRPQPWLRRSKDVLVSAEPGSNSLIIDAPQERMESLQELADKLDRVELPPQAQLRTYRVVGPGLEPASRTLRSMADRGVLSEPAQPGKPPVQVLIEIEPKSGTLIIAGDAKTFETTETLLKELSLVPIEKGLRIFPIVSEDAAKVRDRAVAIYDAQVKQIPNTTPIEVTTDTSTNSLMVVAAAEEMTRFARVMDELSRQAGPGREVRLLELRLAKAEDVVGFLRDLVKSSDSMRVRGGPEPVFEVIEATNQLMVAAQPGQFPVIEALARSLDSRQQAERPPLRILRLRSTEASNLATVLQTSYDARPAEERGKQPVSIQADPATNTLIVSAHEALLPEIESIVSNLNETERADAEGREIRIFPLKIARAEELAQTLDQMFPEPPVPVDPRTRQPRPDLKPAREVVVRADRATNSIIVDAPAKRLPGFEQLVKSLDQQKLAGSVVLKTYRVERADLASVAQTLRELASTGSLNAPPTAPVGISVDTSTRTLIVSAPSESLAAVEDVLKKLDGAPDLPATEMKLYALTSARAERLQPLLQKLVATRVREQLIASGKAPPEGVSLVDVVADVGSNALIITAPREAIATADGLVRALDQQSVATGVEVRVFQLKKGQAQTVSQAVLAAVKAQSKPGEPEAQVTPEPGSNTIVVVGTRDQIEKASTLIEQMDASLDREGLGVRTIPLKHARAEMLAPVLEQVLTRESALDRLPDWARMQALSRGAEEKPAVRVAAEPRLNALIVSGPMGVLDMAEQIAATLDVSREGGAGEGTRLLRVIMLKNADAQQLATNLTEVFKEDASGTMPPTIRVDAASNSLIVRAEAGQMATVEELTGKLDAAAVGATRQLRMVPLDRSRVDAELMARTLQRLMEQQGGTKVEIISTEELIKRTKEEVPASTRPRSELAPRDVGPRLAHDRGARSRHGFAGGNAPFPIVIVASAMGVLDGSVAGASEPQPEPAPEAVVAAMPGAAPGQVAEPDVTIAVDRATNSLVIVGSPRASDRVALLAAQLEQQMPAEPVGVRVVTVTPGLDADLLMGLVRQTVTQIGRIGPANPGGFSGPVSIMQDPSGSSLIVLSGEEDFTTVAKLIASFSQAQASTDVTVKVYPLTSVTAARAIDAVRDLLSPEPRGSQARRLRSMRISVDGPDAATGTIDPAMVRMTADPGGTAVVVAAPREAIPIIDRLIETLDQSPVKDRLAIRRYTLTNARAEELSGTLQNLFDAQRQGPAAGELPQARFVFDQRTNALLVTASDPQHKEVERLLAAADAKMEEPGMELAILTLQQASARTVENIITEVLIGRDPGRRERIRISAEEGSSLLVVRAPKDEIEEIRTIVAQVDQAETSGLPVRSIKLERADANQVAGALQRFFQERANVSSRPGRRVVNRVAVVGDKRTSTVIVSASDEDFEQVKGLVATFDTPAPSQDFQFKVIRLTNARVSDVASTIKDVIDELRWTNMWREGGEDSSIYVEANERANSIVAIGRGEAIQTVERVIGALDQPPEARAKTAIKAVRVKNADLQALRTALSRAFATPRWPSWRGPDPEAITVEVDRVQRALILVGASERVEQAAGYIAELDGAGGPDGPGGQVVESIALNHAPADRAAQNLRQFFQDRARAQGLDGPGVTVVGSRDGNVVIASGDPDSIKALKDLVAQIDQPDGGKDRRIEVIALQNSNAADTAGAVRSMFAKDGRNDQQVIVTPQPSTNSLIVSAPEETFAEVRALLTQLDAPPTAEGANIETIALTSARAQDVATALKGALPPNVKVTVTPVVRSNSLLLTGGKEAIALVIEKIKEIDKEPVRSGLSFRRFKLTSAEARDVSFTLSDVLDARPTGPNEPRPSVDYSITDNIVTVYAAADQMAEVERIITELDQPAGNDRATEFVKLQFANAQQTATALRVFYGRSATEATSAAARNVTILHDALSNSLVIRADKSQWEGIRALLTKLDTQEYDTTRQLAVIALEHADAESVARALNEGLRAPLEEQLRQAQIRTQRERQGQGNREQPAPATVLVDAEGVPTVSAERLTNSLIVFAGQKELARIKEIVKQLDVAGFAQMPAARIIAIRAGKPSTIAGTIREMFLSRQQPLTSGPRSVLIIGDDASSAIIVRADDEKFAQIKALAEALQQQGESGRVSPHVLRLRNVAAGRLRQTILSTFTPMAQAQGETLAVEVDRSGNALVIACSPRLLDEIRKVVEELDQPVLGAGEDGAPGAALLGQSVLVVEVSNNTPDRIRTMVEALGVTRPQLQDRPGIVGEPVALVVMSSRRALAVMGAAADVRAVESLVKTLDAQPAAEGQQLAVIPLKLATASTLAQTLTNMLSPTADAGQVGGDAAPGRALAEQVRRLNLVTGTLNQPEGVVDLTKPIRVLASSESNALIIASTQANIDAIRAVVQVMDTLPVGEAVLVRIFPLDNASAARAKQVVDQLFTQGDRLRRLPGTNRQGLPTTATGRALAGEISTAVDERTNTLIVAGREEAVTLVEVIVKDLDSDGASKWVEPAIIPLKFADASDLAQRLRAVLVAPTAGTPDALGLQRQFGRLRMVAQGGSAVPPAQAQAGAATPAPQDGMLQSDLFAPLAGLVIVAEEQLNAILVVGSPANNAIVRALVEQLDVEQASAKNTVRVFPLQFAAADRVAGVVRDIFRQRDAAEQQRPEDALIVSPDARTNSLIVSTSAKSFAILESLLKTLDGEKSNFSVGLHVIPVTNADARQLAPRIERLMRERLQAAAVSGSISNPLDAFSIEAEPTSNLLIVAASSENLTVVKELLAALTSDVERLAGLERMDVIQLARARAAEVIPALNELYVEKENQRRGSNAVRVSPNERLNAVVVSGTEQDLIELRALAKRLDTAEIAQKQQIHWVELKSASAGEVVRLLQSVLAGRPVSGGGGVGARQATKLQFLRETVRGEIAASGVKPTEADIDGAIKDQVTLNADARTNAVWITAPEPVMKLVMEMIEDIEKSAAGQRKIEKFRLVNADAARMRDLLRDIFNLEQRGDSLVLVPVGQEPVAEGAPRPPDGLNGGSVTAVPDERQQLAIAVDLRTNTLIVSGTPDYIELVREVVNELDAIEANDRERRVYHLRNAKAKDIEATLRSYFQDESTRERATLGTDRAGSLMRMLEEEVTVVGDTGSNKIVISTSPRYMTSVLEIVKELDASPPQVMIQVLLAEVTIDGRDEWGMDFQVGPFGGEGYRISSAAAGSGVTTAIGVPNLAVTSADFGVLIRALESQGKLEVLSNPQVMVNNNQPAEIKVVDEIGVAGETERSGNNNLISGVNRLDAGIILNVTPSISADGFVRMEIKPEISALTSRTTQINADQTAPIITRRTIDTVVTVKDGQSVVIGGLIQTSEETRRTKVPIIGDIPIIGLPFNSTQDETRKTELMVILTPRVIPGQSEDQDKLIRDVTEQAVDRLEDPTKIQDYLERIKSEVRRKRAAEAASTPAVLQIPVQGLESRLAPPASPSAGPVTPAAPVTPVTPVTPDPVPSPEANPPVSPAP